MPICKQKVPTCKLKVPTCRQNVPTCRQHVPTCHQQNVPTCHQQEAQVYVYCLLKLANFECSCSRNFRIFGLWLHAPPYSGPSLSIFRKSELESAGRMCPHANRMFPYAGWMCPHAGRLCPHTDRVCPHTGSADHSFPHHASLSGTWQRYTAQCNTSCCDYSLCFHNDMSYSLRVYDNRCCT